MPDVEPPPKPTPAPEPPPSDAESLVGPEAGSLIAEEGLTRIPPVVPAWKHLLRGPYGVILSSVAFALMNFVVKLASEGIPPGESTFARFLFGAALLGAFGWSGKLDIRARNRRLLITRGVLGSCAILLLFASISLTRLTNAISLGNTYVLFGALFSFLFLGEGFGLRIVGALAMALVGAGFILRPDLGHLQYGDILALAHGVMGGAAITVVRSLRRAGQESPWAILFYLSVVGTFASLLTGPGDWVLPRGEYWVLLLLLGVLGTLGQALLTYAYRWVTTAQGGILSLLVVPISTGLGVAFLGERLTKGDWIGTALILLSSVYVVTERK
ncbi:MAG: DMT family transporter [Armatimonadetes bacterium]|nr:DMT family transporter [Armatimonadota bacterium]